MRQLSKKQKFATVGAAAVVAVASAGTAYAYFSSSGTGTGSATTGTSTAFTVASDAASGAALVPAGSSQTVAFHVFNPGPASQQLRSVVVSIKNADGSAFSVTNAKGSCSAADYTIVQPTVQPTTIGANLTYDGTATISMKDTGSNQDGCQGVTVPLVFAAS